MIKPVPIRRQDIAALTQARLTFGPRGAAQDTATSLRFALDHAKAREAVTSELDTGRLQQIFADAGLETRTVTSAAGSRDVFIRRPDLGRRLPDDGADIVYGGEPVDVALVLGDGLSAIATMLNGPTFIIELARRLSSLGLTVGPVTCARQARVALGDHIARAMGAQTVVMALGERPGLSAADSLGIYVTYRPAADTQDSARNCISNVRDAGTRPVDAAFQTEQLIMAMRTTGLSGVALSQARATNALHDGTDGALDKD